MDEKHLFAIRACFIYCPLQCILLMKIFTLIGKFVSNYERFR